MLTAKDLQEKTFDKSAFGGYNMKEVDEFLETVTQDFQSLSKENSVLKSKLKVLVEKLEEYRGQESALKKTLVSAQQTADNIVAEAQKKASKILNDAEGAAASKAANAEKEIAEAEYKVEKTKAAAAAFIAAVEKEVSLHAEMMDRLKNLSGYQAAAPAQEKVEAPEQEAPAAPVRPVRPVAPVQPAAQKAEAKAAPKPAAKKPAPDLEEDLAMEISATVQEVESSNRKTRDAFLEGLKLDDDFDLPEE